MTLAIAIAILGFVALFAASAMLALSLAWWLTGPEVREPTSAEVLKALRDKERR